MAEYTLKLESTKDYHIIKKLLKAFEGASITPIKKRNLTEEDSVATNVEATPASSKVSRRLKAFDRLAGSVSMDMIDTDDPRTRYLLSK